jgi:hypothetical protein
MSTNLERAAIVLETFSFFLVTIDLFGRERIETLHQRLKKSASTLRKLDLRAIVRPRFTLDVKENSSDATYAVIGLIVFPACVIVGEMMVWHTSGLWVKIMIVPLLGVLATYIIGVSIAGMVWLATVLLERVINGVFGIILYLFNKMKLEGVMVLLGAVLFLASKAMSFVTLEPK